MDPRGFFTDDLGPIYKGLNVRDEKTNDFILKMLKEENCLLNTFKYQNTAYKNTLTDERIVLITLDSWYMRISDKLKM